MLMIEYLYLYNMVNYNNLVVIIQVRFDIVIKTHGCVLCGSISQRATP